MPGADFHSSQNKFPGEKLPKASENCGMATRRSSQKSRKLHFLFSRISKRISLINNLAKCFRISTKKSRENCDVSYLPFASIRGKCDGVFHCWIFLNQRSKCYDVKVKQI